MKELLKVKDISKTYQTEKSEVIAVDKISFDIYTGEFVSIIGPSGCGKSTILSILAGLEEKTLGEIYIQGIKVDSISDQIGYMLQRDCLLKWKNVLDNTLIGLEIKGIKTKENIDYVIELLKKYTLYEFKDKYPNELSGGMRQRVALIRTLATKPQILLLDEAFSALDYQTRIMVTNDIYSILKKEKITTIMVTHDISEAISMSDRVISLTNRPAKIAKIHNIKFDIENRTPMNTRQNLLFSKYFDILWKELKSYG